MFKTLPELKKFANSFGDQSNNAFNLDFSTADERAKLALLAGLFTEIHPNNEIYTAIIYCAVAWHIVREYTDLKQLLTKSREFDDIFILLFMKISSIVSIHAICATRNNTLNREDIFGTFIAPLHCLANHSCTMKTLNFDTDRMSVVVAWRPIKAGDEVTINFGYVTFYFGRII